MTESNVSESITRIKPSDIVSRVMTRSVKSDGVDRLRAKIERIGFQPDKPVRVYPVDGGYRLIDGNHRLEAAVKLALPSVPALVVSPPADHLAEIRQARESNEASETVVPTTFVDDAELVWNLTEKFTQLVCRIAGRDCVWEGATRGERFSDCVIPETITSPAAVLVWLNCAARGMDYSAISKAANRREVAA